jgi:Zn-dependent protease with chaperone function
METKNMNIKKLLIATAAAFAVMFGVGGLTHLVLFKDWLLNHPGLAGNINRPEPMLQYTIAALLLLAFIMAYLYPKGMEGDNKIMQGLKFGIIISVLFFFPCNLIQYSMTTALSMKAILMDAVLHAVEQGLGGIVIALVYGNEVMMKK